MVLQFAFSIPINHLRITPTAVSKSKIQNNATGRVTNILVDTATNFILQQDA